MNGATLDELAALLDAERLGDGDLVVTRVVEPASAREPTDLALAMQPERLPELRESAASLAVLAADAEPPRPLRGYLRVSRPRYALALLLQRFAPLPRFPDGIHPSAVIEPSAWVADGASVGPLCYVGVDARIGPGSRLLAQVTVAAGAVIGAGCLLHPGVRIGEGCRLGDGVIVHPNAVIGADGFSYATPEPGSVESARAGKRVDAVNRAIQRIPSLGIVVLEDDVEVGAATTIDRATLGETRIQRGSKLDNLVMVAHNNRIGEDCLIAAQTGISGSCRVGDRVVMGGQVGVADHLRVGDDAVLAAQAGVHQRVAPRSLMIFSPAIPYREFQERYRALGRLPRLLRQVLELGRRLGVLERRLDNPTDHRDDHP